MTTSLTTDRLAGFVEKAPLERYVAPEKPSLVGLSRPELAEALASVGVPASQRTMRAPPLAHWLYARGATGLEQRTRLTTPLTAILAENLVLARPEVVAEQVS